MSQCALAVRLTSGSTSLVLRALLGGFALLCLCSAFALAQEPGVPETQAETQAPPKSGHAHPPGATTPHEHPPAKPDAPAQPQLPAAQEATPPAHVHTPEQAAAPEHDQEAQTPDAAVVQALLGLTLAFALALVLFARRSGISGGTVPHRPGSNLLEWPVVGKLLRWRHFPTLLVAPTLVVFLFIVLAGLFGEQNTSNPAILLTWILWWPAVIFTFLLLGRIWCTACPFGTIGDLAQRIFTFGLRPPRIFRNMWWRLGLFLALTWATTLWALDRWPLGTALLGLSLTAGAVALAVVYEKRTFCRYVCPLGGIFGLYAMEAPVRIAVKDQHICQHDCAGKNCAEACAWFEFASTLDRNAECNLCLECVRACPHHNIVVQTQAPATDLALFQPHRKSLDEAATVAAVLGVALLQTMVMLNAWEGWEARIGGFFHLSPGPILYTAIFLTLGLAVPVLLVALISYVGLRGTAARGDIFHAFRTYAYAFLPLGLGLHAAHNFHHLFGESGALWLGLKQALAQYTGWGSPVTTAAAASFGPNALFVLQWLALVGGLYLAYRVAVAVARRNASPPASAFRAVLPILLFAVAYTLLNILILSAPMAHRH